MADERCKKCMAKACVLLAVTNFLQDNDAKECYLCGNSYMISTALTGSYENSYQLGIQNPQRQGNLSHDVGRHHQDNIRWSMSWSKLNVKPLTWSILFQQHQDWMVTQLPYSQVLSSSSRSGKWYDLLVSAHAKSISSKSQENIQLLSNWLLINLAHCEKLISLNTKETRTESEN